MSKSEAPKQTLIEAGTKFTGAFASDNPIVVRGGIDGEVTGPSLTVAATGSVSGKVKVKELRSEGELSGEYEADVVILSGRVRDNTVILARVLEVKLASAKGQMQVVFGEVDLEVGDVPSMKEAVEAAKQDGVSASDPSASVAPASPDSAEAPSPEAHAQETSGEQPDSLKPEEQADDGTSDDTAASQAQADSGKGRDDHGSRKKNKKRRSEAPPPAE